MAYRRRCVKTFPSAQRRVQSGPLAATGCSTSGVGKSHHSTAGRGSGGKPGPAYTPSKLKEGPTFKEKGAGSSKPHSLVFSEVRGDLFECPAQFSLAHCVSEDMAMGKGIATLFKEKFKSVGQLRAQGVKPGGVAVLENEGRFIYYLVTKTRSFHKPSYSSLHSSLSAMRDHCNSNSVSCLAMPRIGCGLDKLSWDKVVKMILEVFGDLEMTIAVYYL